MKIIYRIDDDSQKTIDYFQKQINLNSDGIVIPQGDNIKVFVIKDDGEVTELK